MKISMKSYKALVLTLLSAFCLDCMPQSLDANYVMQKSMTDSVNGIVVINYYDGLGRKCQTVNKNAATNGDDQIAITDYDIKGRDDKNWLTIPINGNGSFCDTAIFRQTAIEYYNDSFPFSRINYEDSPLNRKTEEYGAGSIWHNNNKRMTIEYSFNGSTNNKCRKYVVSTGGDSLSSQGFWPAGELDVVIESDEDENKVISFKDMRGLLVLKRVIDVKNSNLEHDTYYVYDNRGNLCFVLPPMASVEMTSGTWGENSDIIQKNCYFYKYNNRNLCVYKKIPGCEPVIMRYDKAHRLVFLQDGNLRDEGKWLYNLYDMMGRHVVTGICSNESLPDVTYRQVKAMCAESTLSFTIKYRDSYGYIANVALNNPKPLSVNYFDYYDYLSKFALLSDSLQFRTMNGYDDKYNGTVAQSAKGLLTGTATRVLGDTTMLVKSLYYDCHGNVIQSHESNAVGGYEHNYYHLTFTGKPLAVRHEHSTGTAHHVDINTMTYDAMERLLTTTVTHDGEQVDVISNTYDDLGRLASQSCLNNQQTTTYSYNIRNWITQIYAGIDAHSFPVMKQSLHYADAVTGSTPCFNGNISAMDWNTLSHYAINRYCYSYDGMNRLTQAGHMVYSPNADLVFDIPECYSTSYSYDLNSNITALTRHGKSEQYTSLGSVFYNYGLIDNLSITRDGNRLKKVTDQCDELTYAGAMDFKDGANEQVEYTWDANGNMTSDLNKGISEIKYNILNLPEKITHNNGHITYINYGADGRKLRVTYKINPLIAIGDPVIHPGEPVDPIGPLSMLPANELNGNGGSIHIDPQPVSIERVIMTRDYCGNYTYRNGAIERILMGNGFMQDSLYFVQIKDYQGNVRAVLDQNHNVVERNDYYPYGGLINASDTQLQPYKYNSKELDRENGLDWYDFSARMYDSMLPQFNGVDALSEKKPWNSPYAYCGGNPILRVDPTGFDEWDINSKGYIVNHKNTKAHDAFFMVDNDNNRINGMFIEMEYGTVVPFDDENTSYDTYCIKGDNNGKSVFELLAQNTNVEWGHIKTGQKQSGLNFLTTSHRDDSEFGINDLFTKKLHGDYLIREIIHSHPRGDEAPSGITIKGDIQNVAFRNKLYKKSNVIDNFIYVPLTDQYIKYSENSRLEDFTITEKIPVVIVYGTQGNSKKKPYE